MKWKKVDIKGDLPTFTWNMSMIKFSDFYNIKKLQN